MGVELLGFLVVAVIDPERRQRIIIIPLHAQRQ